MAEERIKNLADFFYSSNSSLIVPCRLMLTFGMAGQDLTKKQFIKLFSILNNSINLKKDLKKFLKEI